MLISISSQQFKRTYNLVWESFNWLSIYSKDYISFLQQVTSFKLLTREESSNAHYTPFFITQIADEEAEAQTAHFLLQSHLKSILLHPEKRRK